MTDNSSSNEENVDPVISQINFSGKDVLEIGCGAGGFTMEYLKKANSILGIDPDSEAIDALKAEWSRQSLDARADFRPADVVDFPLPEETFDIAVFAKSF